MSKLHHISDPHLSFRPDGTVQKDMAQRSWSKGSPNYVGYLEKIVEYGKNVVKSDDFVVITGDLTHDMKHAHAVHSLRWARANINGTIIACKGNHDFLLNIGAMRMDTIGPNFYLIDEGEVITIGPYTFGCYSDHTQKTTCTDYSKYREMAARIVEQARTRETIPVMISHYPIPLSEISLAYGLRAYLSGHVHCTKGSMPDGNNWEWYDQAAKPTDNKEINGCFFSTGTTDVLLNIEKQIFREVKCLEVSEISTKSTNSLRDRAGKAFKCNHKFIDKFQSEDAFNPGNTLAGFICRAKNLMAGSLYITHVNGAEIEPQLIYGTPKLAYPYKEGSTDYIDFVPTGYFYLGNKWNGTNILFYKYYDSSGRMFITAKTKGTGVAKDSDYGNFVSLTKEALKWTRNESIMVDLPEQLMLLMRDSIQSLSFELCGRKEPHLVKYDFDIALKPLFMTREDGRIEPILEEDGDLRQSISGDLIKEVCKNIQDLEFALNEDYRTANNLKLKYEFEHFATEGKVLYLLDYHHICVGRTLYKIKPKDIEEVHWQSFDSTMQGRVQEAVKKLNRDGLEVTEEAIRSELDMGPKEWDKFGKGIVEYLNLANINNVSEVLVLVGVPGSGKSTFAKELEKVGWIRVNQDELGSRNKCKLLMEEALRKNQKVVIDRCNFDVRQRKAWIDLAKKHNVANINALFIDTPLDVCKTRIVTRTDHPTIAPVEGSAVIVDRFAQLLVPIGQDEGFKSISTVFSNEEIENVLKTIKGE